METASSDLKVLNWRQAASLVFGAAACFHVAYTWPDSGLLSLLIVGYVACVVKLARLRTTRQSFYSGLITGLLCYGPQLGFFWRIFGPAAFVLWLILAMWLAAFVGLSHVALMRLGMNRGVWLIPFLWTGLEYFRSELYYLKFSWLNVGYAFSEGVLNPVQMFGTYGTGFAVCLSILLFPPAFRWWSNKTRIIESILLFVILMVLLALLLPVSSGRPPRPSLVVAGVQLEFPGQAEIPQSLDKVLAAQSNIRLKGFRRETNINLVVLSEYTLDESPSEKLKQWCRDNQKFLIVGGKEPAPNDNFYNTAFVIDTNGEVVFKQVKSVPIQFFKDGLPAPEQKLWDSPWGKIGICICYDLSYTRVTDELVRQGAQMLIVPTMDVADWGRHQHELHARVAPVRAAEYGIPIFHVASSGISQGVSRSGRVLATAPFPGEGEMIFFAANLKRTGSLPWDRYLAPLCVCVTGAFVVWIVVDCFQARRRVKAPQTPA